MEISHICRQESEVPDTCRPYSRAVRRRVSVRRVGSDGDVDGDEEDRTDLGDCRGSGDVLSPVVGPSVADVRAPDAGVDLPLGEDRPPGGLDAALDVPKSLPPSATVEA